MAGGIAAYGNVLPGGSAREFHIEVFRPAKLPKLEKQLTAWASYGFLRWSEENSN